jgi:hypothetical protein
MDSTDEPPPIAGGSNWTRAPLEDVKTGVLSVGYPADRIHFVVGKVEDTLPSQAPEQVALLRLDTDWYESTKHELIHLYPRLAQGGVLIIDDYGSWSGAQRATDEFLAESGARLLLVRSDAAVRYAVKVDAEPNPVLPTAARTSAVAGSRWLDTVKSELENKCKQ